MKNIPDIFGTMVFNTHVMKEKLPKETYRELRKTIYEGKPLELEVANVVANAMKDWAIEKGATHYTHWFQPMTGITAEKHDSFISPNGEDAVIMEFSGKELIKGEPDASSFPSGGLRATFEARGYTAWDPTSFAFIKDNTLCIPTAFCSYTGEALDKKTPLLRSMEAIDKQAMRILRLFGNTTAKRVITTVGPEQEYFLIDKKLWNERKDLIYTGRTLFGAPAPKGQELDDHYFGTIKPRVAAYMKELDEELWKLGVLAKTKHNEAAPAQHELAPIFTTTNIATDHNQLTMEIMKRIATKHGLVCLLHEKPFAGVTGSGKHNNWSLSTDSGENLLNPTSKPHENKQFLLFLCAVIKAVYEYQDLLRISIASAGNDHRLGADEAPPAIVSMFIGDELEAILDAIANDREYVKDAAKYIDSGTNALPDLKKDTTDRNRTSPFAFTGNKFEFRMLGSSFSVAGPNTFLNTMVASVLDEFATRLEAAEDFKSAVDALIKETVKKYKDIIIFNGNNYSEEWVKEAKRRGLLNLKTAPDALPLLVSDKNVALFTKYGVYSKVELQSRCDILLENYAKILNIEAHTMLEMAKRDILPAVIAFSKELADTVSVKKSIGADIDCFAEEELLKRVSLLSAELYRKTDELEKAVDCADKSAGAEALARYYKDSVLTAMNSLRAVADELETIVGEKYWPYPSYGKLLFSVN